MKIFILFISLFYGSNVTIAQDAMKKVLLQEGVMNDITYGTLHLNTMLQIYGPQSADHLIGDIYLKVEEQGELMAEYYLSNSKASEEYKTKIYKNYLLTFITEESSKYLLIEHALFGKEFALLNNRQAIIGDREELIEIEITDYVHEWGYDAPMEIDSTSYYSDVHYTIATKVNNIIKSFSFYSSQIAARKPIQIGNYRIDLLSDQYKDTSCLINMVVTKEKE